MQLLLLLALTVAASTQATSVTTTATRSSQLSQHCTSSSRAQLYNQYLGQSSVPYESDFKQFYSLDKGIFESMIDLDYQSIDQQLRSDGVSYGFFIVPGWVGLGFMLVAGIIMAILLLCPCQVFQRSKFYYTRCERTWPVVIVFVMGAAIIVTGIVGLASGYKAGTGYKQLSCAGIVVLDDALYGNLSTTTGNGQFFSGVSTISSNLDSINNNNLNYIFDNMTALSSQTGSASSATLSALSTSMNDISVIPSTTNEQLSLTYNTPLRTNGTTGTVDSTFPPILGTSQQSSTLVGEAYGGVSSANSNLSSITSSVDGFVNTRSVYPFSLQRLINGTAQTSTLLRQSLVTINDILVTQNYTKNIDFIQLLVYGIIVGVTALFILGYVVFACCGRVGCRYCLNALCFLMFFVGVALFAALVLMSYLSAVFSSGCQYMKLTATDVTSFKEHMEDLGISSTVAQQISVCLEGQSGDIVSEISGQQDKGYLDLLAYAMNNITTFNGSDLSSSIATTYAPLQSTLPDYANSRTLDLDDQTTIDELKYISTASNYQCSGDFQLDSWIPSIQQTDNAIPCQSPQGMPNADIVSCPTDAQFSAGAVGCIGCMDTFSLLYSTSSYTQTFQKLNSRYTNCDVFNGQLSNVWQNYYLQKREKLGGASTREVTARQSTNTARASLSPNLDTTFDNTISQLYATSSSVLTPNYGVLWGLDCGTVGEDMIILQRSACRNTFSYSYFHRILLLIISFCLMFMLCCHTCSVFRRQREVIQANEEHDPRARAQPYIDPLSDARLNNYPQQRS